MGMPEAAGGRTVLIVDDNDDGAMLLAEALEDAGHRVKVARDAIAALELLRSYVPDVALLDIGLPEMDGYELARRIREDATLSGIRLVALTGFAQDGDRVRCHEAGFDLHLVKPIDLDQLEALVAAQY